VSAVPRPQTEDPAPETAAPAPADDGWALLDGLRRRLDDQAAQTRKTQAQVGQLAESIAALVEAGRRRSRWLNINSFVAYLIFTVLLGGAFYFVFQSRARELVASRDRAVSERDRAVSERDAAIKRADEAAAKLAAAQKPADPPAPDVVKIARDAAKAGRYAEIVAPLEAALAKDPGPRAPEMHYLLGVAYAKANALDKAIPHLDAAVAGNVADEDAHYQLASALDRAGRWAKARAEYDKFATAHPQSAQAPFATRRSATLARMPAQGPWVQPAGKAMPGAQTPAAGGAAAASSQAPKPVAGQAPAAAGAPAAGAQAPKPSGAPSPGAAGPAAKAGPGTPAGDPLGSAAPTE
jgi:tetratricopeptide (TPR) repeat protein